MANMKVIGNVRVEVVNPSGAIETTAAGGDTFPVQWKNSRDYSTIWVTGASGYELTGIASLTRYDDDTGDDVPVSFNLKRTSNGVEWLGLAMIEPLTHDSWINTSTKPKLTFTATTKAVETPKPDPEPTPPTTNVTASNRVYLMTGDELKAFQGINLNRTLDGAGGSITYDYSKYVVSLLQVGFKLSENETALNNAAVMLSTWKTTATGKLLRRDNIPISLGKISIPAFDSSVSAVGLKCSLVLPYVESNIDIPPYCEGRTITVDALLDVYVGDLTVNLYFEGESVPFMSESRKIGRKIPLETLTTASYTLSSVNGVLNNTYRAYVKLERPELAPVKGAAKVTVDGKVGDFKGMVKLMEGGVSGSLKGRDRDAIEQLMRNGVIVS